MSRTPAAFTQADVARAIRAARDAGETSIAIPTRGAHIVVNFDPPLSNLPAKMFENPRLISREEAAARNGLSVPQFVALTKEGIFPDRVRGTRCWDRKVMDQRLAEIEITPDGVDPGYVYFMEMGDFIKIGWSRAPHLRMDTLQVASPYDIKILAAFPGSLEQEAKLHAVFSAIRHRSEWFRRTRGLLAYIEWMSKRSIDQRSIRDRANVLPLPRRG